ncbi:MAG: RCC1 domain-containing protein [Candidatus Nanopelagicales bacterium]
MARLAGVWAWGLGESGELGNGGTSSRDVPVQVSGLTEVTAIAGFGNGGFALRP